MKLPQDKEDSVAFQFEKEEGQIELIIGDYPLSNWSIHPYKRPVQVHVYYTLFILQYYL